MNQSGLVAFNQPLGTLACTINKGTVSTLSYVVVVGKLNSTFAGLHTLLTAYG